MPPTETNATGTLQDIGQLDHSVTSEYRIFGPPGTGKTTNLTRQIRRAVERFGQDSVLVTSFSRTAAAELAGRDLPLSPDRIGTLHSHCFHALGCPQIAECNVDDWNKDNPHLQITPKKKQGRLDGEESADDDGTEREKSGDDYLEQLNRWRGMMIPTGGWPAVVREFAVKWQQYKDAHGLLDFCDLIDIALRDVPLAPKTPSVIFADEAQDLNRMQLRLIRKWGERANYFIVAADDDQTIYSFTGATPDAILDPDIPEDHKIILKQSYRVPRAIHARAVRWIEQVTRRQEKAYLPRPFEGELNRLSGGTYKSPEYYILKTALQHLQQGKSVMFLATCGYMLQPIVQVLRKNAVPFHNPYRRSNGFWNPLRMGRGSSANRVLSLLVAHPQFGEGSRAWTCGDLALWAEWLHSEGVMKRGAKKKLPSLTAADTATIETLDDTFEPGALEALLKTFEGDYRELLDWWRRRLNATIFKRAQFPADIAAARGPQALLDVPRVVVGTIHSVKGGEADVVYLFPDLSGEGDAAYQQAGAPRDSVIRQFYVGMTRAREILYICQQESGMAVRI
ncbi:MAG: ATP-dependent helicase [Bryobacteraceae bacterium]|nr:ATP-dependent helicase [Bryobacteraceae bacterium]